MAEGMGVEMSTFHVLTLAGTNPKLDVYKGTIIQNWMVTLRDTNDWYGMIDGNTYFETYKKVINAILDKPDCRVNVAVLSDDPDVCVGWAVYQGKTLHYCFVPRAGRKQKIATALIPEFDTITHLTVPGVVIWKKKFPKVIFNPFFN